MVKVQGIFRSVSVNPSKYPPSRQRHQVGSLDWALRAHLWARNLEVMRTYPVSVFGLLESVSLELLEAAPPPPPQAAMAKEMTEMVKIVLMVISFQSQMRLP